MATGNITTTTDAVMIAQKWTKEVELPFYKALRFQPLVTQRGNLVADGGNVINVPFLSTLQARSKAAGTNVTYDNNTEASIVINVNKQTYSAVLIEDIAKVQASYDLQSLYRGAQAEAVARQVDTDIASLYTGAGSVVSAGATVTDANIISVTTTLDANNVPRSERYGIIGSYTEGDLLNVNKYVAYDQTGQAGVAVKENASDDTLVGRLYGMELHMSNNLVVSAGTPNIGHDMFFHKKALSLAMQLAPTYKMEDSVDAIGMKAVLHCIYGVAVERPTALVDLQRNVAA
jgi:hypothetical protein